MKIAWLLTGILLFGACESTHQTGTGEWVAEVNHRKIYMNEWEQSLAKVSRYSTKDYSDIGARRDLINDLINKELLFQKALSEHLPENSLFLKDQIVQEYLRTKFTRTSEAPSEKEILEIFEKQKNDLEKVRASHILIKPKISGNEIEEKAAKEKAERILKELRAKGDTADFSSFVNKYSQDEGTVKRGGDLMFFKRSDMVTPFSDAAFALKEVGDISDVVKTQYGYHIIKLTGDQRGIERLRPQIEHYIMNTRQKEKVDRLLQDLRAAAKIEIKEEVLLPKVKPETKEAN